MKKIVFIIIFSLSLISSGCYTYYPVSEVTESLKVKSKEYIKIQKFYLYNGDSVDVSNFDIKYYEKYKNYEKVFVCIELPTLESNQAFYIEKKKEEKIIPSEQIKSILIEKRRTDIAGTILAVISISALSLIALFFVLMAIVRPKIG